MIYIMLANGFEETEALTPANVLMRAGYDVKLTSITDNIYVTGTHKITVKADILIGECDKKELFEGLEMLILPGGMPGMSNLYKNETVRQLVEAVIITGKPFGAICAAPFIPGRMGLLYGKKATCYKGYETDLIGAEYVNEKTVRDGNILTARGMGVALDFGLEAVRMLSGDEKVNEIKNKILA